MAKSTEPTEYGDIEKPDTIWTFFYKMYRAISYAAFFHIPRKGKSDATNFIKGLEKWDTLIRNHPFRFTIGIILAPLSIPFLTLLVFIGQPIKKLISLFKNNATTDTPSKMNKSAPGESTSLVTSILQKAKKSSPSNSSTLSDAEKYSLLNSSAPSDESGEDDTASYGTPDSNSDSDLEELHESIHIPIEFKNEGYFVKAVNLIAEKYNDKALTLKKITHYVDKRFITKETANELTAEIEKRFNNESPAENTSIKLK